MSCRCVTCSLSSLHGRTGGKGVPQCQHYTKLGGGFRDKAVQQLRAARRDLSEAASDAYLAGLLLLLSHDVSFRTRVIAGLELTVQIFATEPSWREPWSACCDVIALRHAHRFQWRRPLDKVLLHHACLLDWAGE